MRTPRAYRVLERAFRAAKERNGMRLIQYTVLGNHVHLIVEVDDRTQLSRGMQGLTIRMAKALNKHWRRKGKVFVDRFHAVVLRSERHMCSAFKYVLNNARKHGIRLARGVADPFSSARWFDRWQEKLRRPLRSPPVVPARIWEPYARISIDDVPGRRAEFWTLEELLAM